MVYHNGCSRNRLFRGLARRGHTALGWFFDVKLHLLFSQKGQPMTLQVTRAILLIANRLRP